MHTCIVCIVTPRRIALLLLALWISAAAASAQTPPHYIEREIYLHTPDSGSQGIDALEVYADLPGKHPLAVLTHGTSSVQEERMQITPWAQLLQALWFARRGYVVIVVVRRGYGRSGGEQDGAHSNACRGGSFQETGRNSADDLRAVIKLAQFMPEVDGSNVISAGVSTGGFAQVALSADPPKELKTAISFAGGRGGNGGDGTNCNLSVLVRDFGDFGKEAHKHGRLPMLWVYSENDHWFPQSMSSQFKAAYDKSGGNEQYVLAPPFRDEGHHLYSSPDDWSDIVQPYLKARGLLPLGDTVLPEPAVPDIPPPEGSSSNTLKAWHRYLLAGPYKAFARGDHGWGMGIGSFTQDLADQSALANCGKGISTKGTCKIISRTPPQSDQMQAQAK
jgi:dienelactone hydrolase